MLGQENKHLDIGRWKFECRSHNNKRRSKNLKSSKKGTAMRAYETIKFTEGPDVGDIKSEGRRSRVGRIPRGEVTHTWTDNPKICRNERGYNRSTVKAAVRRNLKRSDKARVAAALRREEDGI
jgi:hypothetical protein